MSTTGALLHDLKSFGKDWVRWSAGERLVAKMAVLTMTVSIIGHLMLINS
jgi:hypothetical protein